MALGETIVCEDPISERLLYGMGEVIKIWTHWTPEYFKPISIQAECLAQPDNPPGTIIGASFSGGVDSLRLLQSHIAPAQPIESLQIKTCVFVQGFDIPLSADEEFDHWTQLYTQTLTEMDINLIPVKTNLHAFTVETLPWRYAYGTALISVGLLLETLFKQYLIASTCHLSSIEPYGSSIVLDHWFSTENMAVRYCGIYENRREKIEALAYWQPARTMLRVCINAKRRKPDGNCCRCSSACMADAASKAFGPYRCAISAFRYGRWCDAQNGHRGARAVTAMQEFIQAIIDHSAGCSRFFREQSS